MGFGGFRGFGIQGLSLRCGLWVEVAASGLCTFRTTQGKRVRNSLSVEGIPNIQSGLASTL